MNAEDHFLSQLTLIERVTAFVCRRNHLDPSESEEFGSHVKLKLIESNYAIIRKFEGRSSFSTYLTTVITRLFFQYRVHLWGKWRPSAEAKRLGDKGVTLERLISRDGYTYAEAVEILTTSDHAFTRSEVESIYLRLPMRHPRPILVSESMLADTVSLVSSPDEEMLDRESEGNVREALSSIDEMVESLPAEDQVIIRMRFWNGKRVPDIARLLGLDQRRVYKRIEKIMSRMRRSLEQAGLDSRSVQQFLTRGESESVSRPPTERGEKSAPRPTHRVDATFGSGKSRLSG